MSGISKEWAVGSVVLSAERDVGSVGCQKNGLSICGIVGRMGCRSVGLSAERDVGRMVWTVGSVGMSDNEITPI